MSYSVEWCPLGPRPCPILSAVHGKMLREDVFILPPILCVHNHGCPCQAPYTPGGTMVTCLREAGSWWCHKHAVLLLAHILRHSHPGGSCRLPHRAHSFLCEKGTEPSSESSLCSVMERPELSHLPSPDLLPETIGDR